MPGQRQIDGATAICLRMDRPRDTPTLELGRRQRNEGEGEGGRSQDRAYSTFHWESQGGVSPVLVCRCGFCDKIEFGNDEEKTKQHVRP